MLITVVAFTEASPDTLADTIASVAGVSAAVAGPVVLVPVDASDFPDVFGAPEVEVLIEASTTDTAALRLAVFDAISAAGGILARFD